MNPFILKLIVMAVLCGAIGGFGFFQGERLEAKNTAAVQARFDAFVAETKAIGKQAEAAAEEKNQTNKATKEKIDHENARAIDSAVSDARRLRDSRASGSYLPIASRTARSTQTSCFDRDELEQAIQRLDDEVSGIIEKGDQAVVDLNSGKAWVLRLRAEMKP